MQRCALDFAASKLHEISVDVAHAVRVELNGQELTSAETKAFHAVTRDLAVELFTRAGIRCCTSCACTESQACPGGCTWVGDRNLCSSCES